MELNLLRVQHGVGQGGFHTSSFEIHDENSPDRLRHSFELVFDCGTVSKGPDGRDPKDFIAERIDAYQNTGDVVDALFISHLDSDHLNGAATLCNVREVLQVFLPYFQQEEMALFIAQQIISSEQATLGPAGLADVVNALSGSPLFGVPVTLIGGPPRDGGGDAPRDTTQPRIALVQIDPTGVRRPVGPSVPAGSQLGLQWAAVEIPWTLLPWSYKQSPAGLQQLLVDVPELLKLQTAGAKVTAQDMEKLLALRPRIRIALTKLIKNAGGIESADFNAPSICLYSGPSLEQSQIRRMSYRVRGTNHRNWDDPIGWITTGDAVLGKYEDQFLQVFSQVLSETGTYVVPHHGARKNHSSALIYKTRGRFALICAKQGSKHHPHSEVLAELTLAGDDHRILTEYITDGVREHVMMKFNL